jgi:hypothetical protein
MIDDRIPGQPEEPAPEGNATRLISRQRLQGLDEDELRQVLRVRRALDAAGDEAIDRVVLMIEDQSEGSRFPVAGLGHETLDRSVVGRHNDGMPCLVRSRPCRARSRGTVSAGSRGRWIRHVGRQAR